MSTGTTTDNLFADIAAISYVLSDTWIGNAQVGVWNSEISVMGKSMSVQQSHSTDVYDYFLIELVGQSSLGVNQGNRPPAGYSLNIDFITPNEPPPPVELVLSSPDTTVTTTTYTDSISYTFNGSIGFSPSGPSVSIGSSQTITNTTTSSIASLEVLNLSGVNGSVAGSWEYIIAAKSLEAQGATPLLGQVLVRRPHSSEPLRVNVEVAVYFSNKHMPAGLDWSGVSQYITGYQGDHMPPLTKGNASVGMLYTRMLDAPPLPLSVTAEAVG